MSGGPFILTKYTPKQIALFKRNPNFYGLRPHIDGFGLQFFQTTDAMITALKSNQLDGVEAEGQPPTRGGFFRMVLRERKAAVVGLSIIGFFVLLSIVAPYISPYSITQQTCAVYAPRPVRTGSAATTAASTCSAS